MSYNHTQFWERRRRGQHPGWWNYDYGANTTQMQEVLYPGSALSQAISLTERAGASSAVDGAPLSKVLGCLVLQVLKPRRIPLLPTPSPAQSQASWLACGPRAHCTSLHALPRTRYLLAVAEERRFTAPVLWTFLPRGHVNRTALRCARAAVAPSPEEESGWGGDRAELPLGERRGEAASPFLYRPSLTPIGMRLAFTVRTLHTLRADGNQMRFGYGERKGSVQVWEMVLEMMWMGGGYQATHPFGQSRNQYLPHPQLIWTGKWRMLVARELSVYLRERCTRHRAQPLQRPGS